MVSLFLGTENLKSAGTSALGASSSAATSPAFAGEVAGSNPGTHIKVLKHGFFLFSFSFHVTQRHKINNNWMSSWLISSSTDIPPTVEYCWVVVTVESDMKARNQKWIALWQGYHSLHINRSDCAIKYCKHISRYNCHHTLIVLHTPQVLVQFQVDGVDRAWIKTISNQVQIYLYTYSVSMRPWDCTHKATKHACYNRHDNCT